MRMEEQMIKFTYSLKGYAPKEVDHVMIELQRKIAGLEAQNASFSNAFAQCNDKIQQMSENTRRLQEERAKESVRITGILDQAMQISEQAQREALRKAQETIEIARRQAAEIIESARLEAELTMKNAGLEGDKIITDANQEAEKIRRQTQVHFSSAQKAFILLSENTRVIHQRNEQYIADANRRLDELYKMINSVIGELPVTAAPPDSYVPSSFETFRTAQPSIHNNMSETAPAAGFGQYDPQSATEFPAANEEMMRRIQSEE